MCFLVVLESSNILFYGVIERDVAGGGVAGGEEEEEDAVEPGVGEEVEAEEAEAPGRADGARGEAEEGERADCSGTLHHRAALRTLRHHAALPRGWRPRTRC